MTISIALLTAELWIAIMLVAKTYEYWKEDRRNKS